MCFGSESEKYLIQRSISQPVSQALHKNQSPTYVNVDVSIVHLKYWFEELLKINVSAERAISFSFVLRSTGVSIVARHWHDT